jgi:hypothetical protein
MPGLYRAIKKPLPASGKGFKKTKRPLPETGKGLANNVKVANKAGSY